MLRYKYKLGIQFVLLFFLSSCLKGNFKLKKIAGSFWEPDVAVPLVNSSLSLQNILKLSNANNNFNIASDNFISLVYKGNLFSLRADEVVKIPDQIGNTSFIFPANAVAAFNALPAQATFNVNPPISSTFDFNSGSADSYIDSMTIKTCLFALNFTSSFQHQLVITVNIPDARKNGIPFSQVVNVPPAGAGSSVSSVNFNLADYRINLNQGGQANKLKMFFSLKIIKTNSTIAAPNNSLDVALSLNDISFKNLFGSIGQKSLAPNIDTIPITLFNNSLASGVISVKNASLGIIITNSFGIPILANFEQFQAYNPLSATPIVNITSPIFNSPITIPTPINIGQSASTSFVLNKANSNLDNVLGNFPRFLIYKINALSNPPPPAVSMQNFIQDTSRFRVDVDINLPLEGNIKNLLFQDTIDFKFQEVEELQSLELKLFFRNGFPIDTKIQVYFADSLGFVTDSLLQDDVVLLSGVVGNNGRVISATEKISDIQYPEAKILGLRKVRKIYVKASLSSSGASETPPKNVKIYSDYRIDLKIAGRAKLKFKI